LANRQFRALGTQARTYANELNQTQMKDLMNMATDAAKSASLNSSNESEIANYFKSLTTDVRNFADLVGASTLTNETMQSVKNQFNKIIEEEKVKKYNQEREKQELKTRPKEETSFNTNTILKSKIDVTFPFGYGGQPTAELQGSYLTKDYAA
jgi:hypothetical protein